MVYQYKIVKSVSNETGEYLWSLKIGGMGPAALLSSQLPTMRTYRDNGGKPYGSSVLNGAGYRRRTVGWITWCISESPEVWRRSPHDKAPLELPVHSFLLLSAHHQERSASIKPQNHLVVDLLPPHHLE